MIENLVQRRVVYAILRYLLFVDMIKSYSSALLTFLSNYSTKNAFVFVYTSLKKFYESSRSFFSVWQTNSEIYDKMWRLSTRCSRKGVTKIAKYGSLIPTSSSNLSSQLLFQHRDLVVWWVPKWGLCKALVVKHLNCLTMRPRSMHI